jgi:protein dithiol:quinone oxidoreductase
MSTAPALSAASPAAWLRSRRAGNALGFVACAGMLGFGFFLQYVKGLEPCPLCILQRLMLACTGILFLIAAIHHPLRRWAAHVYGALIAASALTGLGIAIRHVWIQHTPESLRPACGPGLDFLLNTFGPLESLKRILHGSGECGMVDWTFLTLSIPEWTLIAFTVFAVYAVYLSFQD